MDTELMLDVGQANELKLAFRRADYTNADIKKLCEGDMLAKVLPVVRDQAEVKVVKHLIDCDADPFLPNDWKKVEEHRKAGQLEWDPTKVKLYLSECQQNGKFINGHDLRKELTGRPVLNACVLDYLLAHPELIPDEWKGKVVFFWGTIYCVSVGNLCVRYLYWSGDGWHGRYNWLDGDWIGSNPAALLASI